MTKPKVLLTRLWPAKAQEQAKQLFDVDLNLEDQKMSVAELQAAMQNYDAICPTVSDSRITSDVINVPNRRCKVLCNFGVGFDNIDVVAAKEAGIMVSNTPRVLTDCTADIAMTLLLSVARRTGEGERLVRDRKWRGWCPTHMLATKVSGKKLGFIGFGRIAQAVAQRAHFGFGMQISCYDPYLPANDILEKFNVQILPTIEEVLQSADFVTLHCPGGGENTHLINANRLSLMKPSAFLINTARGDVVDELALVDALQKGIIAGAGLDVFAKEPEVNTPLLSLENVVITPHLGSASTETRVAMGLCALDNVQAFFSGEELPNRVA